MNKPMKRMSIGAVALLLLVAMALGLTTGVGAESDAATDDSIEYSANVQTVMSFLDDTSENWAAAPYLADDMLYRYSYGSSPESDNTLGRETTGAYQYTKDQWLYSLPDDLAYSNPYGVDMIFVRVDYDGGDYADATGQYVLDNGYTDDYTGDVEFVDTVLAKTQVDYTTSDGMAYTGFRLIEFNFDEAGDIVLIREMEDDLQEYNWLREYQAGTYAAQVGDTVYSGADIDTYQSQYDSAQVLEAVNLSTIQKWWTAEDQYRSWMRFALSTEDATMGVTYAFFSDSLFDDQIKSLDLSDMTDNYYDYRYSIENNANNRVTDIQKEGWLGISNMTWGWTTDNRVFTCIGDPNLYYVDCANVQNEYMYNQFTMRDGLVRDFRETCHRYVRSLSDRTDWTYEQIDEAGDMPVSYEYKYSFDISVDLYN